MNGEGRHELRTDTTAAARRSRVVFGLLAALLVGVLGVAIVTQVRDTGSGDSLDSARPADLLVLLDNLNQREAALREEVSSLEATLATLQRSGGGSEAALAEAKARLAALSIQVGAAPATGPGVELTVTDPNNGVGSEVLLDLIQELRAAGAEAIEVGGAGSEPIRIGVNSWVTGQAGRIQLDGTALAAPYEVVAIGDPPTLAAALNIPGGVVDTVARSGGRVSVDQSQQVTIAALRETKPRQYSRPGN
ncbi:DUF881 domain-containing protein [Rhodococcus tukisamuensis]|uniref:Uncharacterized conserved protein YlxW, UPF0749 family n=1 Tax=Rhodococcus tukisamuensis TaxID=168276 RepID=A0A1G6V054_9NOCA|nr:DUF881 domain-containing protein [Rhodococcus tukisamuensis]SDD46938.1 Uncharacterized conserved protein YlxW, UPF0749 family [Rhodococcus tukisamuensis]